LILDATTAGANYLWQDGSTEPIFSLNQSGTYSVEIDVLGCTAIDEIEVIVNEIPYLELGNDTSICEGENLILNASTAGANHSWQDGSTNSDFEVSQTGTYTVEIELLGCNLQKQIEVIVYEIPYLELGNDTSVCEGQILNLDASTIGANYLWQDGSANPDFEVSQAGIYSLEIEVNGCKNKDEIKVNFMFIDANIIGDGLFCNINEVQASIIVTGENPPFTINYSNGEIFNTISGESPFLIDIPQEGTYYTTQVIDNKGCIDSNVDTAIFVLYPKVQASFSVEPEYAYIDDPTITFYNNSLNHYTSSWSFGDRTYYETMEEIIEHIYMFSGDFVVRLIVSNEHMCKDTTEQELSIIPIPFFVPNAFTPGSELINNTFGLSTDKVQKFQMIIFDRWGDEIYRNNDVNKPWDGTKNNQLVPIGVYVYKIDIIDLGYKSHSLVGSLSLLQ
jgi:gliding motility-associated-like protein